jgi:hypothetical protein
MHVFSPSLNAFTRWIATTVLKFFLKNCLLHDYRDPNRRQLRSILLFFTTNYTFSHFSFRAAEGEADDQEDAVADDNELFTPEMLAVLTDNLHSVVSRYQTFHVGG